MQAHGPRSTVRGAGVFPAHNLLSDRIGRSYCRRLRFDGQSSASGGGAIGSASPFFMSANQNETRRSVPLPCCSELLVIARNPLIVLATTCSV